MANDDYARGLVPLQWPSVPCHYYRVATATDIFLGMPVELSSTGFVNAMNVTSAGYQSALGVAIGFAGTLKRSIATADPFLDVSDLTPPDPSSDTGDRFVLVADDPNQEYYIQGDTGGTLATITAAGESVTLLFRASSGNTSSGWANLEFDASSNAASTAALIQLLRAHDVVNTDGTENTMGATYQKWVVKFVSHQHGGIQAPNLNIVV